MWQYYGFVVLRLTRKAFGPFELGHLRPGMVEEVPSHTVGRLLEGRLPLHAEDLQARSRENAAEGRAGRGRTRGAHAASIGRGMRRTDPR